MSGSTALRGVTAAPGLEEVSQRPSWRAYLREVAERRDFALAMAAGDLRTQNMDTALGLAWHLINPLLLVAVYFLVFGGILQIDRGVDNYLAFLVVGIFTYNFSQKSITSGARSIADNLSLIRSINFPRALLPLATVLAQAITLVPSVVVVLTVSLLAGVEATWNWLALPLVYVAQAVFNLGGTFIVARAASHVRDIKNLLPHVFRIVFYVSGLLFAVDALDLTSRQQMLFTLNPFYCYIELARWSVMARPVGLGELLSAVVWTVAIVVVGFTWFRKGEPSFGQG